MTAREKLAAAFAVLRRAKYAARMNFSCCGTCGSYELAEQARVRGRVGFVFWHRQENEQAFYRDDGRLRQSLYLHWDGDAAVIVAALRQAGLDAVHDGSDAMCVEVRRGGAR